MHIINARLRNREGLHDLHLEHGRIASITAQTGEPALMAGDLDAAGNLVIPPFVEPHIHLDATLTAGEQEAAYTALRKGIMDDERRQHYRGPERFAT